MMDSMDLREVREKALAEGYKKATSEIYRRMFTMDPTERISRKRAESLIDGLDVEYGRELYYIGQLYCDGGTEEE